MQKLYLPILLLACIFFVISSCGDKQEEQTDTNTSTQDEKVEDIKIGYIPIADCAQLFVAQEKGYFENAGLNVELVKLAGGAKILEALAGGSVDVAFSNVVSVMLARNGGLPFLAITGGPRTNDNHKETEILVLEGSGIKSLKDLEGKRIAVNTRKNIVELFVRKMLEANKVDLSTIEFVEIPFPQMYQVLDSKNVDAVATIEPFVTFSSEAGGVVGLGDYFTSVMDSLEISTYNVTESFYNDRPLTVKMFRVAMDSAAQFANNNPSELASIIASHTSLSEEQVAGITLPYYGIAVDQESFDNVLNLVKQEGWVDTGLTTNQIIAN